LTRTRSASANRYLFGHVYAEISKATGRSVNDIHDLMVLWFLPKPTIRKVSNFPDGEVRVVVREVQHTSTLTPAAFQAFVDAVRLFAKSCLGVETDDPDYWRYGPKAPERSTDDDYLGR
jgi:hypothetical protein